MPSPLRPSFALLVIVGLLTIPLGAKASAQDGANTMAPPAPPPAPLTLETLDDWMTLIQPIGDEVRWQDIPWRASMWQAVVDAQAQRRPVLLWTMNGHPMGCT